MSSCLKREFLQNSCKPFFVQLLPNTVSCYDGAALLFDSANTFSAKPLQLRRKVGAVFVARQKRCVAGTYNPWGRGLCACAGGATRCVSSSKQYLHMMRCVASVRACLAGELHGIATVAVALRC